MCNDALNKRNVVFGSVFFLIFFAGSAVLATSAMGQVFHVNAASTATTDILATDLPHGKGIDMGAYEFTGEEPVIVTLAAAPAVLVVDPEGGTVVFNVTTTATWMAGADNEWASVPGDMITGSATVTVTCSRNDTGDPRMVNIYVMGLIPETTPPMVSILLRQDVPVEPVEGEIAEPVEGEIVEPVEGEVVEPVEGEIVEPVEGEIAEPVEGEIAEPVEGEIVEPVEGEVVEPSEGEVVEPSEGEVVEPVEGEVVEPSEGEVVEPSEGETDIEGEEPVVEGEEGTEGETDIEGEVPVVEGEPDDDGGCKGCSQGKFEKESVLENLQKGLADWLLVSLSVLVLAAYSYGRSS